MNGFKLFTLGGRMKSVVAVLSVLLFVGLVSAQNKPPMPAGSPQDTMLQDRNARDREAGPMCSQEKRMFSQGKEHGFGCCPGMMGPGNGAPQFAGPWMGHQGFMGRHCPMHRHLFLLLLLIGGIVNILLTIIVSLDMARNNRFNGLWIPVLLIAGIPGSAIYALFRIGDKIQCK
jgi:hypothetical protein